MAFGDIRKKKFIEKEDDYLIPSVKKKLHLKIPSGMFIDSETEDEEPKTIEEIKEEKNSRIIGIVIAIAIPTIYFIAKFGGLF